MSQNTPYPPPPTNIIGNTPVENAWLSSEVNYRGRHPQNVASDLNLARANNNLPQIRITGYQNRRGDILNPRINEIPRNTTAGRKRKSRRKRKSSKKRKSKRKRKY